MKEEDGLEREAEETGEPVDEAEQTIYRDAHNWARSGPTLSLGELPEDAINLNVEGRRLAGPVQGFGRLWQKSYTVGIDQPGLTPTEVIAVWKKEFASFWPKGNRYFGPLTEISPGDVALLNLRSGGGFKLSTGILVMYADEEAFTFMTPVGHQFAGWITFSAEDGPSGPRATVQPMFRAGDPLFELTLPIMTRMENKFWTQTLQNLAARFGSEAAAVEIESVLLDRKRQWNRFGNIRYNSGVRSVLYFVATPVRWVRKKFTKRP